MIQNRISNIDDFMSIVRWYPSLLSKCHPLAFSYIVCCIAAIALLYLHHAYALSRACLHSSLHWARVTSYMYACAAVLVHACMHACMRPRIYASVYVHVSMYVYVYVSAAMRVHMWEKWVCILHFYVSIWRAYICMIWAHAHLNMQIEKWHSACGGPQYERSSRYLFGGLQTGYIYIYTQYLQINEYT